MRPAVLRSARDIRNQDHLIRLIPTLLGERNYENLPLVRHGGRLSRIFFESNPIGGFDMIQSTALLFYQGKCNAGRPGVVLQPLEGAHLVKPLFKFLEETLRDAPGYLILNQIAYNAPPPLGGSVYGPCMWYELTPAHELRRLNTPKERFRYVQPKWRDIIFGSHTCVRDFLEKEARHEEAGRHILPWPSTRKVIRHFTNTGRFR